MVPKESTKVAISPNMSLTSWVHKPEYKWTETNLEDAENIFYEIALFMQGIIQKYKESHLVCSNMSHISAHQ